MNWSKVFTKEKSVDKKKEDSLQIEKELEELRSRCKHSIKHAFTCGGKHYYCFSDPKFGAVFRQLDANTIFTEYEQKIDNRYIESHIKAIEGLKEHYKDLMNKALNSRDFVGLTNIYASQQNEEKALYTFMKQKAEHITDVDLLYKLASVKYFDVTEDPNKWNEFYAYDKIEHWQKSEDLDSFFLKIQFGSLLPSFDGQSTTLKDYTKAQRVQLLKMLELHQQAYSKKQDNEESHSFLESWMGTLRRSIVYQS